MFKVHHSYLHKQPQKVKSCCGKSPRVRICSADREQVRVLHRYSYLRYPFFTLMTMTSQFRACLRPYKNANHVYTMYSSLEIPKCKIFGRLQLACVTSLKTKKKNKEAFTIADCVAVPIAQIKNMSTSSLAWFP